MSILEGQDDGIIPNNSADIKVTHAQVRRAALMMQEASSPEPSPPRPHATWLPRAATKSAGLEKAKGKGKGRGKKVQGQVRLWNRRTGTYTKLERYDPDLPQEDDYLVVSEADA